MLESFLSLAPGAVIMLMVYGIMTLYTLSQVPSPNSVPWADTSDWLQGCFWVVVSSVAYPLVWIYGDFWVWVIAICISTPLGYVTREKWMPYKTLRAYEDHYFLTATIAMLLSAGFFFLFQWLR